MTPVVPPRRRRQQDSVRPRNIKIHGFCRQQRRFVVTPSTSPFSWLSNIWGRDVWGTENYDDDRRDDAVCFVVTTDDGRDDG